MTRQLVGTRAALIGAFFLATSGLFVTYSQFGRYWTLVFLLSSVYPYALYLGIRDSNGRMLVLGAAAAVLAVLAHPCSVLLMGGLGAWIIVTYARRDRLGAAVGPKGRSVGCLPRCDSGPARHDAICPHASVVDPRA